MSLLTEYKPEGSGFFRYKELNGKILVTNDVGDFAVLSKREFSDLVSGKLEKSVEKYSRLVSPAVRKRAALCGKLQKAGIIGTGAGGTGDLSARWADKNSFLFGSPNLHIIVLTKRCNLACVYCHAGAETASGTDMTVKTAKRVLDTVFASPAGSLTIEFQGGEPMLNWGTLSYILTEASERAARTGKEIIFSLVTNLTAMTDERLAFLTRYKVRICTSLDGPAVLHNKNRYFAVTGAGSHSYAVSWLKKIKKIQVPGGTSGDALLTVTRYSLPKWKQIVDEYIKRNLTGIFVRFLNPYGSAKKTWDKIGYTSAEYISFYKKTLDYVIELNLSGKSGIVEHSARIIAKKIFGSSDPNFLDLRSPCGAGIGQIAYNYDGSVYTCDEGRMLAAMGDTSFCMGKVGKNTYKDLVSSPVVRCTVTASLTDIQPLCSECVYKPYCGVCPVYNYSEHGDLFMYSAGYRCEIYRGIFDYIFTLILDKRKEKLLREWAEKSPA